MSPLLVRVLEIADGEVGVRESGGANRGQRVEQYQACAGGKPGDSWCVAGIYWCFFQASRDVGVHNPMPRTMGAARLLSLAHAFRCPHPFPGAVGVHLKDPSDPNTHGHVFLVTDVAGTHVRTIEFNSNNDGSREGVEVVRHQRPTLGSDYITALLNFSGDGTGVIA